MKNNNDFNIPNDVWDKIHSEDKKTIVVLEKNKEKYRIKSNGELIYEGQIQRYTYRDGVLNKL